MGRIRVVKSTTKTTKRRPDRDTDVDLRSPSGRRLPY